MYSFGIGDQTHDPSVAIVKDGKLISAIELERLSRIKHNLFVDVKNYEVEKIGKHFFDLCTANTLEKREYMFEQAIRYCIEPLKITYDAIKYFVQSTLFESGCFNYKSIFINHHLAHAASAFFPSPFEDAAFLTLDGHGNKIGTTYEVGTWGVGRHSEITVVSNFLGEFELTAAEQHKELHNPIICLRNSLGAFYKNITVLAGLGHFGEGKTMGLSAYGSSNLKFKCIRDNINLLPEGKFEINNKEIFGKLQTILSEEKKKLDQMQYFKLQADMAFEAQTILEEIVVHICQYVYGQTKMNNLCFAGGVALNSLLNGKITKKTGFKNLFVQPAASDNGIAIGCAYYDHFMIKSNKRDFKKNLYFSPYLGKKYRDNEISTLIQKKQSPIVPLLLNTDLVSFIVDEVENGKLIGWFNGRSEIGPRALGNRSILADPRKKELKNYINLQIKMREWFRPFAPVVLEEFASDYFYTDQPEPYMIKIVNVKENMANKIPAVVHVDNTARIQTINEIQNPLLYQLIKKFYEKTGVPALLNTSFNSKEEPIVETPKEAIGCFVRLNLDILVLNGKIFLNKEKLGNSRKETALLQCC